MLHMTRSRIVVAGFAIAAVSALWFSASRADEQKAAPAAPTDQIGQLVSRIEKLEQRLAVLEGHSRTTQQANATAPYPWYPQPAPGYLPPNASPSQASPMPVEPARPKGRILLLKKTEIVNE